MKKRMRIIYLFLFVLMLSQSCTDSKKCKHDHEVQITDSLLLKTIIDYMAENKITNDFVYTLDINNGEMNKIFVIGYYPKQIIDRTTPSSYSQINGHFVIIYSGLESVINKSGIIQELTCLGLINESDNTFNTNWRGATWHLEYNMMEGGKNRLRKNPEFPPPPLKLGYEPEFKN